MKATVRLRPVVESDLEIFFAHQADPEAARVAEFPSRNRDAFFVHWRERVLRNRTGVVRTICLGDQVAGNVVLWGERPERLVGYWVGREFWGQGVATAALTQFLQLVVERPLSAWVARTNVASARVLEKCGFRPVSEAADERCFTLAEAPTSGAGASPSPRLPHA